MFYNVVKVQHRLLKVHMKSCQILCGRSQLQVCQNSVRQLNLGFSLPSGNNKGIYLLYAHVIQHTLKHHMSLVHIVYNTKLNVITTICNWKIKTWHQSPKKPVFITKCDANCYDYAFKNGGPWTAMNSSVQQCTIFSDILFGIKRQYWLVTRLLYAAEQ